MNPRSASRRPVRPFGDSAWARRADARGAAARSIRRSGNSPAPILERGLFDIEYRPGKQRGAFCTYVPDRRAPFVFANFTGSRRDVGTLMHEMGHAFQAWQSRDKLAFDYLDADV